MELFSKLEAIHVSVVWKLNTQAKYVGQNGLPGSMTWVLKYGEESKYMTL